jgi:hypothetical protein
MPLNPLAALEHPFPGLRAFEAHEAYLFRGREQHTEELLTRLSEHRFMAVVGNSGSGKSSLVRAGLLPALYRGYLTGATTDWRVAILRPGSAPMTALAEALSDPLALGDKFGAEGFELLISTSMGLVRVVEQANLRDGESLLVVVDQFEELFRFRNESQAKDGGAEASLFVRSLLAAVETFGAPVYIAITMRSDYIGDCAQFTGLTEALNRGQYLVPRLTREQRRQAIEEPAAMAEINIEPRLVQRFLNDAGDDPDQLPVLAHALMRTFHTWKAAGGKGPMDLEHYDQAGGMGGALDHHANGILSELGGAGELWAPKVFRCLTVAEKGRDVRRPARLGRIYEVAGAATDVEKEAVNAVIKAFVRSDNSLLVRSGQGPLAADEVIDITHECLIRKWSALKDWLRVETKSAEWYCDLASDVARHAAGEKGLWRSPDLAQALRFKEDNAWNTAWAAQYWPVENPPSFDQVEAFLDESRRAEEAQRLAADERRRHDVEEARQLAQARKRASQWLLGASILLGLLLVGGGIAVFIHLRDASRIETERGMRLKAEQALTGLYSDRDEQKTRVDYLNAQLATARGDDAAKVKKQLETAQDQLRKTDSEIAKNKATAPAPADDTGVAQIQELRTQVAALRAERDQAVQQLKRRDEPTKYAPTQQVEKPATPTSPAAVPPPLTKKPEQLSADQVRAIKQIVSVFESGKADLSAWERLLNVDVLSRYVQAPSVAGKAQLESFKQRRGLTDLTVLRSKDFDELSGLVQNDPVWKQYVAQYSSDAMFERAAAQASSLGTTTALATAVIFDSTVMGAFNTVRDRTTAQVGGVPATGADERTWIKTYLAKRREFLQSNRSESIRGQVYRVDAFDALIESGNWELKRPFTVRDVVIQ